MLDLIPHCRPILISFFFFFLPKFIFFHKKTIEDLLLHNYPVIPDERQFHYMDFGGFLNDNSYSGVKMQSPFTKQVKSGRSAVEACEKTSSS